jgi:hypothetical protein
MIRAILLQRGLITGLVGQQTLNYKEETMDGYKHYIRTNEAGMVVHGFSSAFEQPLEGDILHAENVGRHFTLQIRNEHGQFKYKWHNDELVERTEAEMFDINAYKTARITELNTACNSTILAGFTSSALGDPRDYDFDYEAQTNLGGMLNAITAGIVTEPIYWKASGSPTLHSLEEFKMLFADGLVHKNGLIAQYWVLKGQVLAATDKQEIDGIVWE